MAHPPIRRASTGRSRMPRCGAWSRQPRHADHLSRSGTARGASQRPGLPRFVRLHAQDADRGAVAARGALAGRHLPPVSRRGIVDAQPDLICSGTGVRWHSDQLVLREDLVLECGPDWPATPGEKVEVALESSGRVPDVDETPIAPGGPGSRLTFQKNLILTSRPGRAGSGLEGVPAKLQRVLELERRLHPRFGQSLSASATARRPRPCGPGRRARRISMRRAWWLKP